MPAYKDSTVMSTTTSSAAAPYINGQQNGNTKVVLVTNESMEIDHNRNGRTTSSSNNGNDEDLTSLTWLHDKNLLKGNFIQLYVSFCYICCPLIRIQLDLFLFFIHFNFFLFAG